MRLIPQYDVIDSPERFTELTWEGLKNYAGNRGGMDATQSAAWASKNLFQAQYGIAPIYNMWNADTGCPDTVAVFRTFRCFNRGEGIGNSSSDNRPVH